MSIAKHDRAILPTGDSGPGGHDVHGPRSDGIRRGRCPFGCAGRLVARDRGSSRATPVHRDFGEIRRWWDGSERRETAGWRRGRNRDPIVSADERFYEPSRRVEACHNRPTRFPLSRLKQPCGKPLHCRFDEGGGWDVHQDLRAADTHEFRTAAGESSMPWPPWRPWCALYRTCPLPTRGPWALLSGRRGARAYEIDRTRGPDTWVRLITAPRCQTILATRGIGHYGMAGTLPSSSPQREALSFRVTE